ncbi:MAG: ROK family protein [Bradymonadales bacterium]|nr:ROK family protein [Bradymonadales bacterium]
MRPAVGFDIGGSTLRGGLIGFEGDGYRLISQYRQRLEPDDKPPVRLVELISRTVERLAWQGGLQPSAIEAIGIGLCGQLTDGGHRVVNSPHLSWREVDIGDLLTRALGHCPITIENDLNAILWGEYQFGRARGCTHVVALFVGSGIGGGTIVEGKLIRGAAGFAGEVGHVKLGGDSGLCRCGERGCTETVAGGYYLQARTTAERGYGRLDVGCYGETGAVGPAEIDAAYRQGDRFARSMWEEVARTLSSLASCCIALIDPELLLLGGGVLEHAPALVSLVRQEVLRRVPESHRRALRVDLGELSDQAGVLGSAKLALQGLG